MWQPKHALGARVEMALGVARGMAAMEAARPPLLHRDLKPTNIFIGAQCWAVLHWLLLRCCETSVVAMRLDMLYRALSQ